MPVDDRPPHPDPQDRTDPQYRTVLQTDAARQGETGHNVRYVLGFGLFGAVVAVCLVGYVFGFFN